MIYSAAERVHASQLLLELIDVDSGNDGVYCKTCMVRWPCKPIENYRKALEERK